MSSVQEGTHLVLRRQILLLEESVSSPRASSFELEDIQRLRDHVGVDIVTPPGIKVFLIIKPAEDVCRNTPEGTGGCRRRVSLIIAHSNLESFGNEVLSSSLSLVTSLGSLTR